MTAPAEQISPARSPAARLPLSAIAAMALLGAWVVLALAAAWIAPYDPDQVDLFNILQAPSAEHWFGTDQVGRDVLSRIIYGARIDLAMCVLGVLPALFIGTAVGLISGYHGGVTDALFMRIYDITVAFPFFVLVLAIVGVLGPGLTNYFIALALVAWVTYARIVRAEVLVIRQSEYVLAARVLGYAALRVDMRGAGDSQGLMHDEYTAQELQDGCDVIAWIAAQPWCDGNVGMMGKSWGAYNSFQIAALRPPALKAIIPVMGTDDRWEEDIHFRGGVMATDNFWWGSIMQLLNTSPPDPDVLGDRWRGMWLERLNAMTLWTAEWTKHQTNDQMWKHGSVSVNYDDIEVPVYFFGGWADLFRDTPFRIAQHLKAPCKVLMGPWAHLYPHDGIPGPKVDFVAEAIRWWDHWLKGVDSGLMDEPLLRCYIQDTAPPLGYIDHRDGTWVEESGWPSPNVAPKRFWLNHGGLGEAADLGGLALAIRSPQTYGAAAGDIGSFAIPGDLPADCRIDEGGALSFRSAPLTAPLNILGQAQLHLRIAADQPQVFVTAVLADEALDGSQRLITRGVVNLCHRESNERVTPVIPGEEMSVSLPLWGTGRRVPEGHRLVLHVASTYWPALWPAPKPVTLSLAPGATALDIPVRTAPAGAPPPRDLPAPPPTPKPRITPLAEGRLERTVTTDLVTGRVTHRVFIDGGVFGPIGRIRFDDTGTEFHDVSERLYEIHPDDPLSARAAMTQSREFARGDWRVRTETWSEQTATADHYVLKAWCKSWEGDELVHEIEWLDEIPRNGM